MPCHDLNECLGTLNLVKKVKKKVKIVTIVNDFLDWSSFDWSWPCGGYKADVDEEEGTSNKENEWVAVPVSE